MTRAELSAILTDLVRRNAITLDDARLTLDRYDAGDLTDLPLSATQQERDGNSWVLALALVLFLLNRTTGKTLSTSERRRAQRILRIRYDTSVAQLAETVAAGGPIATWQAGMQTATADYARQMAVAGAGTLPRGTVQSAVDANLAGQWPYLTAFATTLLVGAVAGSLLSEAAIASRSVLYGETGWGAFWRGAEPEGVGQIVHYEAKDDGGTCSPCSEAARRGPYVVGASYPRPGEICDGRGRCRCTLRFEYNLAIYNQLMGRA